MTYLEKMANEGVQTHKLVVGEGSVTTMKSCTNAYGALQDQNPPSDQWGGGESQDWLNEIQTFFVQSCVTGLPKSVSGQSTGVQPSSTSSSATPSASSTH
jgi:hypothetical protein